MKVLLWSAAFWPHLGGLEVLSAELLRSLRTRGVEFCVVTTSQGPPEWEGVPVHRFSLEELALNGDLEEVAQTRGRVRRILRDFRPDLVHVNGIGATIPMHILCSDSGIPYVVTLHGSWENWRPPLMARLFSGASWIAACSRHTLGLVRDFDPGLLAYSSVIRNALPFAGQMRERGRHLLCAGRVASEKGFDVAIRAVAAFPGLELRIAGSGTQLGALQELCQELGVADRVHFLGALDRTGIAREMASCRALLVPSRIEGFGLVALEAAQAGTPVLAARVGGLPEVVRHRETGLLVDPGGWEDAIRQLQDDWGERAREWAREEFPWSDFVDGYLALYERVKRVAPEVFAWRQKEAALQARFRDLRPDSLPWAERFLVAGEVVEVRTDSDAILSPFRRAWAPADSGEVSLRCELATGELPIWDGEGVPNRWEPWGLKGAPSDVVVPCQRPRMSVLYRRATRELAGVVGEDLLPSDLGKPLLLPLLFWFADRGVRVYHGSVAAWRGQGVLFVGGENAGKTTALLACLRAGWDFVCDDLFVIGNDMRVEGLYSSVWLEPGHARKRFGELELQSHPLDPKGVGFAKSVGRVPISAAVCVTQVDGDTRVLEASRGEVLRALLPSSFGLIPGLQDGEKLRRVAKLLRGAAPGRLALGEDMERVSDLLLEILGAAGA